MEQFIQNLKQKATNSKPATKKLFNKLQKSKPKKLDLVFHELHQQTFEHIDCLSCANCCKTISPILYQSDIDRLAKSLRMKPRDFMIKYIHIDEDNDFVFNTTPCPMLGSNNYCSVYTNRPKACREYPHTNRKKMYQILPLTLKNTAVCPAVYKIVEALKQRQKEF
ncbi:MAG: YkgJ family cysteine cluster protein [Bacteroidetes bacterium]|jgi:Fe-S-cluster containining protein|nr:YkgJ family cysteine cluster protein [Bacteroidota bacterium]